MLENTKMISRILRDVTDGVLVLDQEGTVLFLNPKGEELLNFDGSQSLVGRKYAAIMLEKNRTGNHAFHQFLLESLYDSENTHKGEISYTKADGTQIVLNMTTSFLFDESGKNYEGVVIQFTDVTEVAGLRKKQEESSFVFVTVIVYVCTWVFFCIIWEQLGRPVSKHVLTWAVQLLGVGICLLALKKTSFTVQDMGLGIKNIGSVLRVDAMIAAVGVVLLIGVKWLILRLQPDFFAPGTPFFNFDFHWSEWIYPVVVVLQEFLSRSVMHENLRRVIAGKHKEWMAIAVSSLMFGVLHIYMGIFFMLGATVLLGALGMLYRKQGTIWGLCIPHYILGTTLTVLGFTL